MQSRRCDGIFGGSMPVTLPDHLVLATRDLDAGAAWLERQLGATLAAGGQHARMGTHNRLLQLGAGFYLELIAIDPQAPPPGRPRWFGLDRLDLPGDRPRLIHWVARSEDIAADAARCAQPPGDILSMERGDYRWRITVPADGSLPGDGLLPTLIQWDVAFHPADRLPDAGCRLMKLEAFHPRPEGIRNVLATLGLDTRLDLHPCTKGEPSQLVAYVNCPRGLVELD
jgi:hypothetical protein